jgi:hypothetical protein
MALGGQRSQESTKVAAQQSPGCCAHGARRLRPLRRTYRAMIWLCLHTFE